MSSGILPVVSLLTGTGLGFLGGNLLGGSAVKAANSALASQVATQNALLMRERQKELAEQQETEQLFKNQSDADLRRLRYGQSTYATIGGGMGQPVTPNQVLGVTG